MNAPIWIQKEVVLSAHEEMLSVHGGSAGIRDKGLVDSALNRPENLNSYDRPTLFDLAAAYAFGIIKNHPFIDGNKRVSFLTAVVFLERNGFILNASEAEATLQTLALADGSLTEEEYSAWLKDNSISQKSASQAAHKPTRKRRKRPKK